jgi:hypothetical protein
MSKSNLVLHAVVFKKEHFKDKSEGLKEAHKLFPKEKLKKFVRETDKSFRFRVVPKTKFEKTTFVSKKISPHTTLVFGKLKVKGGAVEASQVKDFVESSYKNNKEAKENIGDYKLDKQLSTRESKVYHDPKTNKTVVANRGTKGSKDWANNALYGADVLTGNLFHFYDKSDRMKKAEKVQEEAIKKYGKVDSNIGHSQSGIITRKLNDKNKTGEIININPASFYEKPKKNEHNYRSTFDPVSYFSRGATTIKDYTINPLKAHSTSF